MIGPAAHSHAAAAFHLTPLEGIALVAAIALVIFLGYLVSLWCKPMTVWRHGHDRRVHLRVCAQLVPAMRRNQAGAQARHTPDGPGRRRTAALLQLKPVTHLKNTAVS